jgi:hypothetical protein
LLPERFDRLTIEQRRKMEVLRPMLLDADADGYERWAPRRPIAVGHIVQRNWSSGKLSRGLWLPFAQQRVTCPWG